MKFSYNLLQEYFKQKLPKPEKLADILTMHSFETGSVTKSGKDYILDIDVLSNRMPDCSGHEGVAREIGVILNSKFNPEHSGQNSKLQSKIQKLKKKYLEVKVEDKNLCSRYVGAVIRNIKVGESSKRLKEILESLGINSINNIVDATNYVMFLTGQPLHVFDMDKIENTTTYKKQIIVRHAKNGESIISLDNKKYDLDESVLVIADSREPLAIAGIKGGKKAEFDFNTKNIVLEAANFNLTSIRKTSQKLNLRTDASIRFSYNLDPNLCETALIKLINMIKSFCGGETAQLIDIYPKKSISVSIRTDFNKIRQVLGVNIKNNEIKNILQSLGFNIKQAGSLITVYPPTIRRDISIEEDLIEEVGRVYGYEKIKSFVPVGKLIPLAPSREYDTEKAVKNFFAGQGFSEICNYSFISENDREISFLAGLKEVNELQNPLSSDIKFLRPALIFNVLKNISLNLKNYNAVRIFEFGKVFSALKNGAANSLLDFENNNLAAAMVYKNSDGKKLFFKLKGIVFSLFELLEINGVKFENSNSASEKKSLAFLDYLFHPYRHAKIKIKENSIGILGEVKNDILARYDIKNATVVFFEIDFNAFLRFVKKEEKEFKPFSKFPKLERDLSLFTSYNTRIDEIKDVIENQGGELLASCEIFDIYEPSLQEENEKFEGRKSLAFRLTFQSKERTLLDEEVNVLMEKIIKALEENLEWEVRK